MLVRLKAQEITPAIVSLREQLEEIRVAEIEKMRSKLGVLTPQQKEAIETLTRGIVNKIAHGPITELRRQAAEPEGGQIVETIKRIFRLH